MQWLHLRFVAPLASFGGEAVDVHGIIRPIPALSMITGLIANAFGWTRSMIDEHQILQDRIVYGAAWESSEAPDHSLIDYQTVQINKNDTVWTTSGRVAERTHGGSGISTVQRWQHYHCDIKMTLVIRLSKPELSPTLNEIAIALKNPARPLFIGRKCCLPSDYIFRGKLDHFPTALSALCASIPNHSKGVLAYWSQDEENVKDAQLITITDQRDWSSRLHGGTRHVFVKRIDHHSQ